jgi:hypothetical protein
MLTRTKVEFNRFYMPSIIFNNTALLFEKNDSLAIADYFKRRGRDVMVVNGITRSSEPLKSNEGVYSQETKQRCLNTYGFVQNDEYLTNDVVKTVRESIQLMFQTGHKYGHDVLVIEGFGSSLEVAEVFRQEICKTDGLFHTIVFTSDEYSDIYASAFNKK